MAEALEIDKEDGNTLWWDAILKQMCNVRPAFEKWEANEKDLPVGYQRIGCHLIFDIKIGENLRRKARLVANGNESEAPPAMTYSSVISRDSVRITLLLAKIRSRQSAMR